MKGKTNALAIREIIDNNGLLVHFQQIVSVSRKMVVGVEGLIRGVNPVSGEQIEATQLFEQAKQDSVLLALDRACRQEILAEFSKVHHYDHEKLLFINLDATILEHSVGSNYLLAQVQEYGIDPSSIVIEISEKNVQNDEMLKQFVDTYKAYGFMVALDDVGTGFSNMDRILLVKPDIIKIDCSLVKNIHNDYYKQGIFKSLVILSNKIGALVVAEGVELEEEAIQVLRLGGHMIQGFFLSVPSEIIEESTFYYNDKIDLLSKKFKQHMNLQYTQERNKYKQLNKKVKESIVSLTGSAYSGFDAVLQDIVSKYDEMECAYILDSAGIQISRTICADGQSDKQENRVFYSAQKGTDHSMEKYYYPLTSTRRRRYTTEPYVSLATGNLCVTISAIFESKDHSRCILCADFITGEDSYNIEVRSPMIHHTGENRSEIAGIINKLNKEIYIDSLTGSYNRRYLNEKFLVDQDKDPPVSIILTDIDHFKNVNDKFGHLAGDQVLKEFVSLAKHCIRRGKDWIARYGGDEFVIVLVDADEYVTTRVAEKIRCVCEQKVVVYEGLKMNFTVSLGAYTCHSSNTTLEDMIGLADRNLYIAKNLGRNKSVTTEFLP